jgi:hypothetical protein
MNESTPCHGTFSFQQLYRIANREFAHLLSLVARKEARIAAALAAAGLVLTPAFAATNAKKRPPAISLSFDSLSSFTPANADPKLAASLAGKGLSLTDFKFTPAPAKGRPSQVRVAIRARVNAPAQTAVAQASAPTTAVTALTPTSYNLGVAVGWRRFAVSGDVAKVKDADPAIGGRETAVVGVSYSLNKFTGRVAVGADKAAGRPLPALRQNDTYSLDVGGSYSLSRHIAVTGGVRYNIERDRLSALQDDRRDSQAVYIGTAFKF